MDYKQLDQANALKEKIEMTKKFRRALNECRNHHAPTENRLTNIEIKGYRCSITSVTYEKILDVLDDEIDRYENEFANFLSVTDEAKDNHTLYEDAVKHLAQLAINLQEEYNVPMQLVINHIACGIAQDKNPDTIIDNIKNKRDITDESPIANVIMNKVNSIKNE